MAENKVVILCITQDILSHDQKFSVNLKEFF